MLDLILLITKLLYLAGQNETDDQKVKLNTQFLALLIYFDIRYVTDNVIFFELKLLP